LRSNVTPAEEVTGGSQTISLIEEEAPISKHVRVLEREKIWQSVLTGPGTKIYCAGKGQQQFN
jgi:hypothetical protein